MTVEHDALRIVTNASSTVPVMTDGQWVGVCDECGALLLHPERHESVCPATAVIQPPKSEPIPIDRHAWATVIGRHRLQTIEENGVTIVGCSCGIGGDGSMALTDHDNHAAAMVANYVEANR